MGIQGVLDSVNGFIDRVHKAPLLIAFLGVASHDVWRTLESDKKDERKDRMIQVANDEKDRAMKMVIAEQEKQLTLKDTILNYTKREFQQLLK